MQEKQHARIIVTAISLIAAGSVNAAGFALIEQNASGLGNAYAGKLPARRMPARYSSIRLEWHCYPRNNWLWQAI